MADWLTQNLSAVIFLVLGSMLGLFASWFTARYSRKAQKADERRERVYAPLFDELAIIKKALDEYAYPFVTEYERIASAHLLYLVPKNLRVMIRELYDRKLKFITRMILKLRDRYRQKVLENINEHIPREQPANAFNDSNAMTLATDLADFLLQGQIPSEWLPKIQPLFVDVKGRLRLTLDESSVIIYFKKLLILRSKDMEMAELDALKEQCAQLVEAIQKVIARDLETHY